MHPPPGEAQATGEALLARIKELAPTCSPVYLESLVSGYAELVRLGRHGG